MEFDGKIEIKVERGVFAHHFKRGGKVLKAERVEFKSRRNFKKVMQVTKDDMLIFRMKCEGHRTPFLSTQSKIKIRSIKARKAASRKIRTGVGGCSVQSVRTESTCEKADKKLKSKVVSSCVTR
eukprot:660964-Amorphochlora_amoeboformis.AAC.1